MSSRSILVCVSVLLFTAGFGAIANAGLLSLYTFDDTTNNEVGGAPNGTLAGDSSYVDGKVGKAISLDGTGDYVSLGTSGIPNGSYEKSGSLAFWINTSTPNASGILTALNNNAANCFMVALADGGAGAIALQVRSDSGHVFRADAAAGTIGSGWHQVAIAWDAVGTGASASIYVDGVSKTRTISYNAITADDTFSSWGNPMRIGSKGRALAEYCLNGLLDDMGVWSNQLTAVEVSSLYNLATDSVLKYNAQNAQTLFDIYAGGQGSSGQTSDGKTWQYVSGLAEGTAGAVVNNNTLYLTATAGVQSIPEPSTITMLTAVLCSLLCYAWRKRK